MSNLNSLAYNPSALLGVLFVAILANGGLFGVLTQQFYSYWTSGFQDSRRLKAFVVTQFAVTTLQYLMICQLGWNVFVISYCGTNFKPYTWQGPASSVCQCLLALLANMFLATRIYSLTESRLQCGLVMVMSITAFVFGLVTIVMTWNSFGFSFLSSHFMPAVRAAAVSWHLLQAISECLISAFLTRALLKSRSGFQKSDALVHYLIRRVIQVGLLTTTWAIAGSATWLLMPKYTVFAFFDSTTGSIHTHIIFDTLLARTRLRESMAKGSNFEMASHTATQSQSLQVPRMFEGQRGPSKVLQGGVSVTMSHIAFSESNKSAHSGVPEEGNSEFECASFGQAGAHYELPYEHH
ncbi:hypothetical protein BC826DRAFT_989934 [Russula brevipes]|nr:hypothetical protein BC826DRAFT_989934 [Russula brevipes]